MTEQTFSLEYRQALEEAVSALDEIVGYLEQASLSLTTEEPKTLRVIPVVRERVFRVSESQDAPWVSLQTLLWSPDPLYARFVDPAETPATSECRSLPEDREAISPFDDMIAALHKTRVNSSTTALKSPRSSTARKTLAGLKAALMRLVAAPFLTFPP